LFGARGTGKTTFLKQEIIDEVQKVPALLDVVHHLIEESNIKFVLTGSNARKLKHDSANLLAGRAFVNNLFHLLLQNWMLLVYFRHQAKGTLFSMKL